MRYVPLAEDLSKILDSYEDNPLITENQRARWGREGRRKAITHGMLGKDDPNALRLLEEDGYDGKPVGSLSRRSAESFWYYNENHVFPPEDDLMRLGIFMHLDLYRIIALVLKGKWEEFFAREVCGWRANVGRNLSTVLEKEDEMQKALSKFNPNTEDLLSRLCAHANINLRELKLSPAPDSSHLLQPLATLVDEYMERMVRSGVRWLSEARYTPEAFDTLVQRMLLDRMHWVATDSPELQYFKRQAVEEVVILSQGTNEERQEYWTLNLARNQLLMDLDDICLRIESARLQNAKIHYKYLSIFGQYELAFEEAKLRHFELDQKILLKRTNPELGPKELEELVQEKLKELRQKFHELSDQAKKASLLGWQTHVLDIIKEVFGPVKHPITPEERTALENKIKKILRQIWLLIHPDRLRNDPVYEKLTPEQKEELKKVLDQTLRIEPEQIVLDPTCIESWYRSVAVLEGLLDKVKFILKTAGLNVNVELGEIRGDTLPERLSWLRKDIERLEGLLESARLELHHLITDEGIQQELAILKNEGKHEEIKREMEKKTEELKERIEELEAELAALTGVSPNDPSA